MKNGENESVKLQDTTPTLHIQVESRRRKKLTLNYFPKKVGNKTVTINNQ